MQLNKLLVFALSIIALTACASAPLKEISSARLDLPPYIATENIDAYRDQSVLWGGMIIEVRNFAKHSEIELIAYPLDSQQAPKLKDKTEGRFVVIVPEYIEALDFPNGRFLTVLGKFSGTRTSNVNKSNYEYALVDVQKMHLWPRDFAQRGPKFSIGVGVSF